MILDHPDYNTDKLVRAQVDRIARILPTFDAAALVKSKDSVAEDALESLNDKHRWDAAGVATASPIPLPESPEEQWRVFLRALFPDELLWMRNARPIEGEENVYRYQNRDTLLSSEICPAEFMAPCFFGFDMFTGRGMIPAEQPYFVMVSETLTVDQSAALFNWCCKNLKMKLHAVIEDGGDRLYGVFALPPRAVEIGLMYNFPQHGLCESRCFDPRALLRVPGSVWKGRQARLLYLAE